LSDSREPCLEILLWKKKKWGLAELSEDYRVSHGEGGRSGKNCLKQLWKQRGERKVQSIKSLQQQPAGEIAFIFAKGGRDPGKSLGWVGGNAGSLRRREKRGGTGRKLAARQDREGVLLIYREKERSSGACKGDTGREEDACLIQILRSARFI